MNAVVGTDLVLAHGTTVRLSKSSFTIPAGRLTAVIGPNGAGKTTLLDAIAGMIKPHRGRIEVSARSGRSAERIAYVLQAAAVDGSLPVTVREVVAMGRYAGLGRTKRVGREDREAVDRAIARTGLGELASRHLGELSAGQRQRVFVAQGLAQDHDLLLLDEPLTGIDLPTAQAIDDLIHEELTDGCTVVLTTHDLSEARVADHVVLLSGRVVAHGPPADVLTTEHLVEAYGPSLLHVEESGVVLDDPAHASHDE